MDIEQSADACGGLAWISEQLFEIEGRLAAGLFEGEPLDPRTRAILARSSRRYGQHAQWWRDTLPDSPALAGSDRVCSPTEAWDHLIDHILDSEPTDAVTALYELAVPELISVLEHLNYQWSPISDGAFIRVARMVAADLDEEWSEAREAWPIPHVPSCGELEGLSFGLLDDYNEKRWPPLVTHPRSSGYRLQSSIVRVSARSVSTGSTVAPVTHG